METQRITTALHTKAFGRQIDAFDSLPSTNTFLKEKADAPHGAVVIATNQTAGRGRRGRDFFSPQGGLYMSIRIHRAFTAQTVGLLTSAAAVAVAQAIESLCPVSVQIKWVNDLLIHGKKVCGILTEGAAADGWAVVGIGVNVNTADFPAALADIATSLYKESGKVISCEQLAAAILNALEPLVDDIENGVFLQETRRRSAVIGKDITVMRGDETFAAHAVDIDDAGGLVIQRGQTLTVLTSGEVSIRV